MVNPLSMVFLEIISCWAKQFKNCDSIRFSLKFFLEFLKKKKNTLVLNILKISEIFQRQNYSEVAKVSLKQFSSKKHFIEIYTYIVNDLEPSL